MKTPHLIALMAVGGLFLAGCDTSSSGSSSTDENGGDDQVVAKANLRVLHASPDAPAVNIYLDGAMSPAIEALDYGQASAWANLDAKAYEVDVYGILPDLSDTPDAVIEADPILLEDVNYTVVAVNSLGDISAKLFADDGSTTDSERVRVQVAHLTASAPAVDIHVTASAATLSENTVTGTIGFEDGSDLLGPALLDAGEDYRIRVTLQNTPDTVVFDSGTIALTAGSDLFIGAIPNVSGVGESPIALAVLDGSGSAIIYDETGGAAVRAAHLVSDVGTVDVYASTDLSGDPVFADVDFQAVSDYAEVPEGSYDLAVSADDGTTAAITEPGVELTRGMSYTVLAIGTASGSNLELLPFVDDRRSVATAVKVRLIHGASDTAEVDIYVTADGNIADVDPTFADVPYKATTGFVALAAGSYNVKITPAGDKGTVAIDVDLDNLEAGQIYTAIARNPGPDALLINDSPSD